MGNDDKVLNAEPPEQNANAPPGFKEVTAHRSAPSMCACDLSGQRRPAPLVVLGWARQAAQGPETLELCQLEAQGPRGLAEQQ
jgi:hypothetical protein